jgi:hypothetical protein
MACINRIWAMPNSKTFSIKPIKELVERYLKQGEIWLDPFCGDSCFIGDCITNDLQDKGNFNMEALEFLKMQKTESADGILFDPPYSPRQISECYKNVGLQVHMEDTQSSFYSKRKDEVARICKPKGIVICFGWNSQGIGKNRGFELLEILLVPHGGAHNDTICTVEQKWPSR